MIRQIIKHNKVHYLKEHHTKNIRKYRNLMTKSKHDQTSNLATYQVNENSSNPHGKISQKSNKMAYKIITESN